MIGVLAYDDDLHPVYGAEVKGIEYLFAWGITDTITILCMDKACQLGEVVLREFWGERLTP